MRTLSEWLFERSNRRTSLLQYSKTLLPSLRPNNSVIHVVFFIVYDYLKSAPIPMGVSISRRSRNSTFVKLELRSNVSFNFVRCRGQLVGDPPQKVAYTSRFMLHLRKRSKMTLALWALCEQTRLSHFRCKISKQTFITLQISLG